jgi:hypothetical protein
MKLNKKQFENYISKLTESILLEKFDPKTFKFEKKPFKLRKDYVNSDISLFKKCYKFYDNNPDRDFPNDYINKIYWWAKKIKSKNHIYQFKEQDLKEYVDYLCDEIKANDTFKKEVHEIVSETSGWSS